MILQTQTSLVFAYPPVPLKEEYFTLPKSLDISATIHMVKPDSSA